jgi:hemolysin activation/secretion protein
LSKIAFATFAGVMALAVSTQALAQDAGAPPVPVFEPIPSTTREVVNPPAPPPPAPTEKSVRISGGLEAGPCPLADSDVRTTITSVRFAAARGGELPPELARLLEGLTPPSGEQPIKVVCELRDQAQARLAAGRYVASIQIPQQRISDGVLQLNVVWGHITEVRVRGDAGPYEDLVRRRIEALKAIDPLNQSDAERVLLLANDVPGLTATLALSPAGGSPGDLIGDLTVSFERLRVYANVQNYNSKYLGRETLMLRAEAYGLTGLGDVTSLALLSTAQPKEQKIAQLRHTFLADDAGDTVSLVGTIAQSRPDIKTLDLRTLSRIAGIEFSHPLVRTLRDRLSISSGLEYSTQRTRVYGEGRSSPLNLDRIAALYVRLDGATRTLAFDGSEKASLSGSLQLRKGLDILGATTGRTTKGYYLSRFDGDATATIIRGNLAGSVHFGPVAELFGAVSGQWSDHALLNYDEFSLGNLTIGRGYDPGANSGDRAIGFTIEPRANIVLGRDSSAQFYGFYDAVQLWNLDQGSTEKKRYIESIGGGVRFSLLRSMRLDLTYTHPLDPPLLTGANVSPPGDRVLFSLTVQLVPFGR